MDTTKAVTHVSLCAGYGGIELGLSRAIPNLRSVALCEIEAFACANLVAKMESGLMDAAPIWTDLKSFPWAEFCGRVDILSGGYPCQPFSAAGKRLGKEDPRHLWPFIADGIAAMRPSVCFFENVEGHISMGLSDVIEDLAGMGYRTTWGIFSAREVGAPHQRKRVFILAYRKEQGLEGYGGLEQSGIRNDTWPSRPGQPQHEWEPPRVVGNSNSQHRRASTERREHDPKAGSTGESVGNTESRQDHGREPRDLEIASSQGGCGNDAADSASQRPYIWKIEPSLGRDADGSTCGMGYAELCISCDNRTDELRLLGNGVVPATAERAFRTLLTELLND